MFKRLYPDEYFESAYVIPYEELYAKGYRGIIYDIDNTLVPHGAPADERSIALFEKLKALGFSCTLLSNNRQERVDMFNKDVNVHTIYKAGKPSPKGYLKACELMGTTKDTTISIGDQIFTDVWGAKRAGIRSFMVRYIDPKEEIQIILKRRLEYFVLKEYMKHKK
ncbi:MAG: YqeG family HAD IIIA-type phosphatase [Lachnospiraceae bacterium]|nr:YqeG family HAD IIIA-type phosphatase [Lachnospiraceae bacterium]